MRGMRFHSSVLLGLLFAAGALPAACGGETDTHYGPPDGLVGRQAPQPTATSTGSSSGGGSSSSGGDSGMPPPPPADAGEAGTTPGNDSGTPPAEGGTGSCAVSWTNDVFPMLESTGTGACGGGTCHASGAQPPTILDGNAAGTYNSLKGYTLINAKPYIAPGDTNLADSTMDCDLVTGTCGANRMPLAPGVLSPTQLTTIDTWVKCGAPQN
jgi:hypothetical protein